MKRTMTDYKYALCLTNVECDDLELRKMYQIIPDKKATSDGYIRVIDDSGEDYLYPESYFVPVRLPQKTQRLVEAIA